MDHWRRSQKCEVYKWTDRQTYIWTDGWTDEGPQLR